MWLSDSAASARKVICCLDISLSCVVRQGGGGEVSPSLPLPPPAFGKWLNPRTGWVMKLEWPQGDRGPFKH